MKRREFMTLVGVGSATPLIVSACTPKAAETSGSSVSSDGFQEVGKLTELQNNKQIIAENLTSPLVETQRILSGCCEGG